MPHEGLEYIKLNYTKPDAPATILFVDQNMPVTTGWEFIDLFDKFDVRIKKLFKIYMLSSSINNNDIARACANENIVNYIVKPLTDEKINFLI